MVERIEIYIHSRIKVISNTSWSVLIVITGNYRSWMIDNNRMIVVIRTIIVIVCLKPVVVVISPVYNNPVIASPFKSSVPIVGGIGSKGGKNYQCKED